MNSSKNEKDSRLKFDKELKCLLDWLELSKVEKKLRSTIFQEIKLIIETTIHNSTIESVGSYYSGMYSLFHLY